MRPRAAGETRSRVSCISAVEGAKTFARLDGCQYIAPYTVFRVRVDGLKPRTTYYYTVDSKGADGQGDGVKSAVKHFTTP